ncbi:MAG: L,D-transpeptidase/peptidoglycan binding protein [Lachnospiraceae bacterium]|nr:L,D-transpeptidase/peptidoglycan binding protein [Lachnospiraceae bacterium]
MKISGSQRGKKIGIAAGIGTLVIFILYIGFGIYFQGHFFFRTTINGVGVSAASVQRAQNNLREQVENYRLILKERGKVTEEVTGQSIDMEPAFDNQLENLVKAQNGFAWPYYLFSPKDYKMGTVVEFDEDKLDAVLEELSCMDRNDWVPSENAKILNYEDGEYQVQKAVYGTVINEGNFLRRVREAVSTLEESLDLSKTGCYLNPVVTEKDAVFEEALETMNQYVATEITYTGLEEHIVLDSDRIAQWLSVDENYQVSVDGGSLSAFVKELAESYNTIYTNREFTTSYGETITVCGGSYGWQVDKEAEKEMILADLDAGNPVKREPVYVQTANSHGDNDYGSTYVEINITAQHLFFYKDGKLIVESDFVSGNPSKGNATPTGTYRVTYKAKDATLRGDNYTSKVNYWIPFNNNVGMHDASWRTTFGGTIYKRSGSHGCVNLPESAAQKIYENVEAGYPVVVYELEGTESALGLDQDAAAEVDDAIKRIGTVTLDKESLIEDIRKQYDALSDTAKPYVTGLSVLHDAEKELEQLKEEQDG